MMIRRKRKNSPKKHEGEETEDLKELEEIESKLKKGEDVCYFRLGIQDYCQSETIYSCPRL